MYGIDGVVVRAAPGLHCFELGAGDGGRLPAFAVKLELRVCQGGKIIEGARGPKRPGKGPLISAKFNGAATDPSERGAGRSGDRRDGAE